MRRTARTALAAAVLALLAGGCESRPSLGADPCATIDPAAQPRFRYASGLRMTEMPPLPSASPTVDPARRRRCDEERRRRARFNARATTRRP